MLDADELGSAPLGVQRHGEPLVFWRSGDSVHCALDQCPHRWARLSLGTVQDGCLTCPFHGFRFDPDGQCTRMPPDGPGVPSRRMAVQTWEAREAHGFVWIWWGARRDSYPPIPWFDELQAPGWRWRWSRITETWDTHWSRVAENQLDFTHLPFVHRTSIGRGLDPAVEVRIEGDGDRLTMWASNQKTRLELVAPNLWRNRLGDKVNIVMVFAAIDEGTTRAYVRFYQRIVPLPVLGDLVCWLSRWPNAFILGQDRRVVTSQHPAPARLRNGEQLVKSDAPIIWFRRWQQTHGPRGE